MNKETEKTLVASSLILEQQHSEIIKRQMDLIGSVFETLIILSPEAALSVIEQLGKQLNEDVVKEMAQERIEYLEKIKESVIE